MSSTKQYSDDDGDEVLLKSLSEEKKKKNSRTLEVVKIEELRAWQAKPDQVVIA